MHDLIPEENIPKYEKAGMSREEWEWLMAGPLGGYLEESEVSELNGDFGDREAFRYQLEDYGEEGIILPMMDKGLSLRVWNRVFSIGSGQQRENWGFFVVIDQSKFGKLDGQGLLLRLSGEDAVYDIYDNEDKGIADWITVFADSNSGTTQDNMIESCRVFRGALDGASGSLEDGLVEALAKVYPLVF